MLGLNKLFIIYRLQKQTRRQFENNSLITIKGNLLVLGIRPNVAF